MREFFLQILQEPRTSENSINIMRVLTSLALEDFQRILTVDAEKAIARKAFFEPHQTDLIQAMRNRIARFDHPELSALFSNFERENHSQETSRVAQYSVHDIDSMRTCYDIARKTPHINQFVTADGRRAIRFEDSDHPDVSLSPLREGVVEIFVGQRNADVPVSLYLNFLRLYLEKEGHFSARNMIAFLSLSKNGGAQPFFHLCVDKRDEAAIFALMDRFFVVAEGRGEIERKLEAGDQSPVHFILTGIPTTIEAILHEFPSNMVLFSPRFELKRTQQDAAALPALLHHPMSHVQWVAPVTLVFIDQPPPLPYFGVNLSPQPGFRESHSRVGMFSGSVSSARPDRARSRSQASVENRSNYPIAGGREIIPANATVPRPSFMAPQQNPPAAPAVEPPSNPLVAVMRSSSMKTP